ncbi:MAG TPA: class F sortase [Chloroflexota bacterium]|jgi:LPXTG-site transpeptidase (sortase) family protein|nr:class F sortase [Chloroflexota bacterium]
MARLSPIAPSPVRPAGRQARPQAVRARVAQRQTRAQRLGTLLLAFGALLLVLGGGTVAYAHWAEWQHARQVQAEPPEALPARLEATPLGEDTLSARAAARRVAPEVPIGEPVRMEIPRINVRSSVMALPPKDGEYQVPSFDVGYHADSARMGEVGNAIFNGHLETIDAGRVFARLHELAPGDAIYVYTATHRFDWVVQEVRLVPNTDRSFLLPTTDTRITLYTCAGQFDLRTRDYTHRLVVTGKLVRVSPRA